MRLQKFGLASLKPKLRNTLGSRYRCKGGGLDIRTTDIKAAAISVQGLDICTKEGSRYRYKIFTLSESRRGPGVSRNRTSTDTDISVYT